MPTRTHGHTPRRGRVGRPHLTVVRNDEPPAEPHGGLGTGLRASTRVTPLQLADGFEANAERLAALQTRLAERRGLRWMRATLLTNATLIRALARASATATRDVLNA